ncbi:MAG: response regulator [Bdellovibrionota bacterium]|nr:response regulator [Bdellovibrionota bacterium]
MNILIVEDEPLIARSLKKLLEKKGATVTWEPSGNKAIEIIKQHEFDRIICDLMLQDISGFDVLEESKERFSIDEIGDKVIIITAYSSAQVLERATQYGCLVLSKPFENLNNAIEIFIKGKESAQ